MRVNIYAEELPDICEPGTLTVVTTKVANTGREYHGARMLLKSADELHHDLEDDDRSAVTFWGPPRQVVALLRDLADLMALGIE